MGRDAVQADHGVDAFSGASYREGYLPGDTFALPETLFHGRGLYAKTSGGNLPGWTISSTTVLANRYPADLQCRLIILIDLDLQLHPPVVVLTLLWGDPVDLILILRGQESMRREESVSGNPIDRRSTTKEDIAVIQEKPSEVLSYLYGLIYVLDLVQLTFDGRDPGPL